MEICMAIVVVALVTSPLLVPNEAAGKNVSRSTLRKACKKSGGEWVQGTLMPGWKHYGCTTDAGVTVCSKIDGKLTCGHTPCGKGEGTTNQPCKKEKTAGKRGTLQPALDDVGRLVAPTGQAPSQKVNPLVLQKILREQQQSKAPGATLPKGIKTPAKTGQTEQQELKTTPQTAAPETGPGMLERQQPTLEKTPRTLQKGSPKGVRIQGNTVILEEGYRFKTTSKNQLAIQAIGGNPTLGRIGCVCQADPLTGKSEGSCTWIMGRTHANCAADTNDPCVAGCVPRGGGRLK
jgi:hypothetical protein